MSTRILILKDGVIKPASSSDDLGIGGSSLVLGTTSSTAYRGDYGNIAYNHSQLTNSNPHGVTKALIGLPLADNTADSTKVVASAAILTTARTINGISFNGSSNITINAVDSTARIASSEKGVANGVVPLNSSTLIDSTYLPSYVDDVLEYSTLSSFPTTGETGKLYVAIDTNLVYRWSGSVYSVTSSSLALGATSTTAFRGDYGNTAYTHSQITSGNPHGVTLNSLVGTQIANRILRSDGTTTTLSQVSLTTDVINTLPVSLGGTGQSSYTIGDLLYASATNTLSKLIGVATGNVLLSGGIGASPSYGKVGLTTHITGVLDLANGGTGSATKNFVDLTTVQSVAGDKTLNGIITISNSTASTSTTTGGLIVTGGGGFGGNLNIGGYLTQADRQFRAAASASQSLTLSTVTKVTLGNIITNTGNQYTSGTSRLTAIGTEVWRITIYITFSLSVSNRVILYIYKNGLDVPGLSRVLDNPTNAGFFGTTLTVPEFPLVANDYLEVYCQVIGSGTASVFGDASLNASFWYGNRIR